jgi:hypothetical protein
MLSELSLSASTREPYVAIIFGWLGSTAQQLTCYDRLHKELGATLILMIPCSRSDLFDQDFVRKAVDEQLEENKAAVVAHVFGNGGMLLYHRVFGDRPNMASMVTAAIFDSTPGEWLTLSSFVAFSSSPQKPLALRVFAFLPLAAIWALLIRYRRHPRRLLGFTLSVLGAWAAQCRMNTRYFRSCVDDPVRAPALYLYSSKDRLVKPVVVERLVAERRRLLKRGLRGSLARAVADNHMRSRCWTDSLHVSHYEAHPEDYRHEVESLIRDMLTPKTKHRPPRSTSMPVLLEKATAA